MDYNMLPTKNGCGPLSEESKLRTKEANRVAAVVDS